MQLLLVALPVSGPVLWGQSYAAFSALTTNPTSSLSTGTVALSDDDSNSSLFAVTGMLPAGTGVKCLVVTYSGTASATVKVYGSGYTSTKNLGSHVNLTIEEGSGSTFSGSGPTSCPGFAPSGTIYDGTLADFASARVSFATGVGTFAPTGSGQTRVYRFTYSLDAAGPDETEGGTAALSFTWEAR